MFTQSGKKVRELTACLSCSMCVDEKARNVKHRLGCGAGPPDVSTFVAVEQEHGVDYAVSAPGASSLPSYVDC